MTHTEGKLKRVESRLPQLHKKGIALPAGTALVGLVIFLLWYWSGDEQAGTVALAPSAIELSEIDTPKQAEALVQEQTAVISTTLGTSLAEPNRASVSSASVSGITGRVAGAGADGGGRLGAVLL